MFILSCEDPAFAGRSSDVRGEESSSKPKPLEIFREIDFEEKVTHAAPSGLIVLVSSSSFIYDF